ncbi:MAG TPA: DMT family transporter [Candidatus Thioglobus sp.]|jgi:drug/metabolite transporter (DMT)-like permease|nr:DMT family transporter [Candidatus Thioglobus sp.]HIL42850.1 DMT family transporter [Gammaproteobacteria bacterium]
MENLRGILFMILAMAGFALEDLFIKLLSLHLPVSQILITLGFSGASVFFITALLTHAPILHKDLLNKTLIIRTFCELFAALFFVSAIALTPLSSATSILMATPLMVTIGAAVFFGEKVGWRRWTAVTIGFCGVLLILRPGFDSFMPASLLAVISTVFLAVRDLVTRAMRFEISTTTVSMYAFIACGISGFIAMPFYSAMVVPSSTEIIHLISATFVGVIGYYAIVLATRNGDASVISSFRYSRLVFVMLLATIILAERPDLQTLSGAAIIVLSGVYTFIRENKLSNL